MPLINYVHSVLPDSTSIQPVQSDSVSNQNRGLKYGIWAYFILLIFEGALRKWFLPELANPLLIIRDPLALWLLVRAATQNRLPANSYLTGMAFIGITGTFTAILVGHGSWPVALFSARILLLHFPLIFVIGRVFTADDVLKMGKVSLQLAIPMTVLIALQFYSPQSSWVNQGVGADKAGAGFDGALGYYRPPATFSFTNGTALFYGFVGCFIFYFWLNPTKINRLVLIGATIGLLIAIPLSISRTLFYHVCLTILFTAIAVSRKPGYIGRMILAAAGMWIVLLILNQVVFFQTSTMAFTSRFEAASANEGGIEGTIINRFLGGLTKSITEASEQPFWGYGLGMGTNVGAQLLSGDRTVFLISEDEWGRVIGELGMLLGLYLVLLRVGLTIKIGLIAYKRLRRGDLLPWLLLSFGIIILTTESWSQPTSSGFCMLIGGLMVASLQTPKK